MSDPITVGEAVQKHGYCELMMRIVDLAEALGRVPVGEWDYTFVSDPRWRVILNGGTTEAWEPEPGLRAKRFHALIVYNGWPAGEVDAAGGWLVLAQEDAAITAVEAEIAHVAWQEQAAMERIR